MGHEDLTVTGILKKLGYRSGLTGTDLDQKPTIRVQLPDRARHQRPVGIKPVNPAEKRQLWFEIANFGHQPDRLIDRNVGWIGDDQIVRSAVEVIKIPLAEDDPGSDAVAFGILLCHHQRRQ